MKNSILFYIFVIIIIIIIILYLLYYKANNKQIENFLIPYTRVFSYTGTIQTFTVPTGITSINIYCWGAGGGNTFNTLNTGSFLACRGGNGGFVKATLTIPSGTTSLAVIVGQGGRKGVSGNSSGKAFGGGGDGISGNTHWNIGGGGGLSGVFVNDANMTIVNSYQVNTNATPIIIAGAGGGGGGVDSYFGSPINHGGNGGTDNGNDSSGGRIGGGGTQTTGGTGASGAEGAKYRGGNLTSGNFSGGGGAGWYGGGARDATAGIVGGGGGGSSYINNSYTITNITNVKTTTNGTATAPGNTESYYQAGIAVGAAGTTTTSGLANGGNGLVVIEYMDYSPEERAALGRKNAILNSIRESAEAYNSELTAQTNSLEITSELQKYPSGILDPSSVSSTPQLLNRNLRFGNEEYEIFYSSFDEQNRNNTPINLFNGNIDNSAIIDSDNPNSDLIGGSFASDRNSGYDLTSGNYIGQKNLTINGTQLRGEGIYIKAPSAFIIRKYGFVALTGNENYAPGKWMLFGTNSTIDPDANIQATLIDDATGSQLSRVNYLNKYSWYLKTIPAPTPPTGFTTYIFIFTATARSDLNISEYDYNKLNFSEITIYGHPPATTTTS